MKNKLSDLTDHLFTQLERVNDESLTGDELRAEIARAGALSSLSSQVINAWGLAVAADKLRAEMGNGPGLAAPSSTRLLGLDRREG